MLRLFALDLFQTLLLRVDLRLVQAADLHQILPQRFRMVVQTLRACCEVFPEAALRLRQIIIQIAAHHIPDIHQLFIIGMQ